MAEQVWLTAPIEIIKTAGTSSDIWLIVGSGSPDGDVSPQTGAAKGSIYIRDDATDDYPSLYIKVDNDNADDDWVPLVPEKSLFNHQLGGNMTFTTDKRTYYRDTDLSIYSDSASQLTISTASFVNITGGVKVAGGTEFDSILAGSGTIEFGALTKDAASTACMTVTSLTQAHYLFLSACSVTSPSLRITGYACSPGGGQMSLSVANSASETSDAASVIFGYFAVAACGA